MDNKTAEGIMQRLKESTAKKSTYQEICIYSERQFFLYDWHWSMAYTCVMDRTNKNFILPESDRTVFNTVKARIDSKVSDMFRKVYEHCYITVNKYRIGE